MTRVAVHWNFHKNLFSVVEGTRVAEHTNLVCLQDAQFCVGPKGRERVLREQVKNVHARIRGTRTKEIPSIRGWRGIAYDPYRWPTFVALNGEIPVVTAEEVVGMVVQGKARLYARGLAFGEIESPA